MRFLFLRFLAASALVAVTAAPAVAADCESLQSAGYRVLRGAGGKPVAVWYPSRGAEADSAYGTTAGSAHGRVAVDGAPAACAPMPVLLFSHGLAGCALQSLFITEELARHGYIVVAPEHADAALCATPSTSARVRRPDAAASLLLPGRWNETSYVDRLNDLHAALAAVANDERLGPAADMQRVGAIGHSLGGYAALGMGGAWPGWRDPAVKAVLALSPFVAPYLAHRTLGGIAVPVMYQGAVFDWGITPTLEGASGAYAETPAPRYFVKLKGGNHFEWTNLLCAGQKDASSCLAARANAELIDRYAIAFFDRYLKGRDVAALSGPGAGLDTYRFKLH